MSILINPILVVLVPFEVRGKELVKRDDLPRFIEPHEVIDFMKNNPSIHQRGGLPVHLQWIEHDEAWAIHEYYKEVGRAGWRLN